MDLQLDLSNPLSPTYKDLLIQNNDLVLVDGQQAILQDILQTLSFLYGEWFLNNQIGIPYFQQILVKNPDQRAIDAIFIDAILGVPGVQSLSLYQFIPSYQYRNLAIEFIAQTTSGIVSYSGVIPAAGTTSGTATQSTTETT